MNLIDVLLIVFASALFLLAAISAYLLWQEKKAEQKGPILQRLEAIVQPQSLLAGLSIAGLLGLTLGVGVVGGAATTGILVSRLEPSCWNPPDPLPPDTIIAIETPKHGEVNIDQFIYGTAEQVPDGQEIWIVIGPHEEGPYYPQDSVQMLGRGEWRCSATFGDENDFGDEFDIIAVLTSEDLRLYGESLECPPEGTVVYERITVTRR